MPKIWQNLKILNYWLTDSPTWIQEMLARLKIPQFIEYFLLSYTWTVRKGNCKLFYFPRKYPCAPPLPFFFFPSLINLLNFSQHWNNCMYFLFPFPRQNISHNYYWLNWRHPIQNFQDTFCSHKIWTFVRRSDSILCLNVIRDVQVKSRRRKTNKSTMQTTLPEQ